MDGSMEQSYDGFAEFSEGFSEASGNQTGQADEPSASGSITEADARQEAENGPPDGEQPAAGDQGQWQEEKQDSGESGRESGNQGEGEEQFSLKVNGNTYQVPREKMTELAQKGMDYDRVRQQRDAARAFQQENESTIASLKALAESVSPGMTISDLIDRMRVNMLVAQDVPEAVATERVARENAERMLREKSDAESAEATKKERVNAEIRDFQAKYPGVDVSEREIREMSGDLAAGMSFVEAYQKRQLQEKESALESLRRQLEAEKKNNQNRASSPGSQSDAGSPKTSNAFDEFIGAFNT
ncbi:MAG: hypothetical protein V8T29_12080 [Oscillospiraceae bacterium]|jgi:hypothetical protein|nr:MAG TPA: hypothetical protein [Caudoviricetes sp.]DAY67673.1 MAG TPA: hypothetical protein [Caudoviricetes sp.]